MLTPEYLGDASAYLVRLYDDLEDEIIRDIARRIVKTGELTKTAMWQYQQLQHIGALQQEILQKVAEHTGKTDAEIRRVFAEAMDINIRSNAAPLIAHGIAVDVSLSPQQRQILEAMVQRTSGNIQNLTMTTGTTGSQLYYECSNMAYMKVISGAYSPAQAIFEAVKEAGRVGATVAYPSRTDQLDVAVRRNVLTSLNQTAGRITEMNAKDLDAEYYETSAHPGARPSHAGWQGRVFKIEGATADYPNFQDSTEYGTAGGLCGINCRHSFFLFWPGISVRAYSPEKLAEYANHTVEYNGKEYHDYEASQIQRKFERSIRESKRELAAIDAACEAAEDEETAKLLEEQFQSESGVLKEKEARLKDFLQQTGRDVEKDRVRVAPFKDENGRNATWGRSIAQRARYANDRLVKERERDIIKSSGLEDALKPGERLPNSIQARTDANKIQGYALNSNHPVGKEKARVFNSVLGYHYENWYKLSDKIFDGVQTGTVSKVTETQYGTKYVVPLRITGEKNKSMVVNTVWQIDKGKNTPRLVTLTFDKRTIRGEK